MPKTEKEVAAELADILRSTGEKMVTMTWPEFYKLNDMKRFHDGRHENLRQSCKGQGLIIGIGNNAIVVTQDANHSPK
ncbi:hypothetical protein D3C87_2077800 [compost metagenome]